MTTEQTETVEPPRSNLNTTTVVFIVLITIGFGILHQYSRDIRELASDSFETIPLHAIPLSRRVKECLLFSGLGFALSWSAARLILEFARSKTIVEKFAVPLLNLKMMFIFLAAIAVTASILGHALFD